MEQQRPLVTIATDESLFVGSLHGHHIQVAGLTLDAEMIRNITTRYVSDNVFPQNPLRECELLVTLRNGSSLSYRFGRMSGYVDLEVPGILGTVRVDASRIVGWATEDL